MIKSSGKIARTLKSEILMAPKTRSVFAETWVVRYAI